MSTSLKTNKKSPRAEVISLKGKYHTADSERFLLVSVLSQSCYCCRDVHGDPVVWVWPERTGCKYLAMSDPIMAKLVHGVSEFVGNSLPGPDPVH